MNKQARRAIQSLRKFLIGLPRSAKSTVAVAADFLGFGLAAFAAIWLLSIRPLPFPHLALIIITTGLIAVCLAWCQGLYRSVVRYMGFDLYVSGCRAAAGSALAGGALMYIAGGAATPVRWAIVYWTLSFIYVCSSRYFARVLLVKLGVNQHKEGVIIYGAGSAGVQLAISLRASAEFLPVAMLDDDPALQGTKVKGLEVYPSSMLQTLCHRFGAERVLLAMPSAGRYRRRQVLERLAEFPVRVQTMPEVRDIVSGRARFDDIRDVDVKDLLGRDAVPPNLTLLGGLIRDKSVMVTGAGGSIGSELCRQILHLDPQRLVLFEISEAALYGIGLQLKKIARKLGTRCEIVPLLGSAHHEERVREVMQTFSIQTVYHAAAYKHVPIVERNLFEGIHNNVFGTLHTARAAIDSGVEAFVLISTDKAVSPTSVMGATKRFAELVLQAYNSRAIKTRLCMVRFGNVLESSGSVVPLFREQIRNGGPVTITHRDIIRYFMTIPEAAQLVIQAGSMAHGGDVFVLDMGKPVRIQDLAYSMINLMGLTVRDDANPDGEIEIEYIGLRPAEKLYEELLIGSNVSGTEHPRIRRANEGFLPFDALMELIEQLKVASAVLDHERARNLLLHAVQEYRPHNGIDDLVWLSKQRAQQQNATDTVVDFPAKLA